MDYPIDIIPVEGYPRRLKTDRIMARVPGFLVCRTIDRPVSECVDKLAGGRLELDPDCLGEHIAGLSLNIMGGKLKECHLRYRAKGLATDTWRGEKVGLTDYEDCYVDSGAGYPLYYTAESLHRVQIPMSLQFGKKEKGAYKAMKDAMSDKVFEEFNGRNLVLVKGEIWLEHVPTKLNYWHMQLEAKPEGWPDNTKFRNAKSWRGMIYKEIKEKVLLRDFIYEVETIPELSDCVCCPLERHCGSRNRMGNKGKQVS